jgi:hypothetical protein
MAAALLAIGCAPARPAPSRWVALALWEGAAISYEPASVHRLPDGAVQAMLALDYTVPQMFQQAAYTRHEMLVHVHCAQRLVGSTDYRLFANGRQVRHGTNSPEWFAVREEGSAESVWFPALCRDLVLAAVDSAG